MLTIKTTKKYGRGLYATKNIKRGEIIEVSPVLVLDKRDAGKISDTLVNIYVFEWNRDGSALAFGNGSLFNHSRKPNVTYMNSFGTREIMFVAIKDIRKGQQLFINYGYEPEYGIKVTKRNKEQSLGLEKEKAYGKNRLLGKDEEAVDDMAVKEKPMDKLKYEN